MDIGPPRRIIEVEPISVPLPIDLPSVEPTPAETQPELAPTDPTG